MKKDYRAYIIRTAYVEDLDKDPEVQKVIELPGKFPRLILKFSILGAQAYQKPKDRWALDNISLKRTPESNSTMPTGSRRDAIIKKIFQALRTINSNWELLYDGHCRWPMAVEADDDSNKDKIRQEIKTLGRDNTVLTESHSTITISVNYEDIIGEPYPELK